MSALAKNIDAQAPPAASDGELLMRFVRRREKTALAELVDRYAPMVRGVCRQVLRQGHDVDDAFQATFLILARRAHAIENSGNVGGWLYRVAYRTAMRMAAKRRQMPQLLEAEPATEPDVFSLIEMREAAKVLHEELAAQPARYRDVLVLQYFVGKTREEIAEALETTDAVVKGRLARGRKALRLALARRGVGLSVALGATHATMTSAAASTGNSLLIRQTVDTCHCLIHAGNASAAASQCSLQLATQGVHAMMISTLAKTLLIPATISVAAVALTQLLTAETNDEESSAGTVAASSLQLQDDGLDDPNDATLDQSASPSSSGALIPFDALPNATSPLVAGQSQVSAITDPPQVPNEPTSPYMAMQVVNDEAEDLELLEKYYAFKVQALEMRIDAKKIERAAYSANRTEREDLLAKSKAVLADADVMDLVAERHYLTEKGKQITERRKRLAKPSMSSMQDGAAPGPARLTERQLAGVAPAQMQRPGTATPDVTDGPLRPGELVRVRMLIPGGGLGGEESMDDVVRIEPSGTLPLGPVLGRVNVAGKSLVEAEELIKESSQKFYRSLAVQLTRASGLNRY